MSIGSSNRGRALETTIIASQGRFIRVRKMTAGVIWKRSAAAKLGGSPVIPIKGPVDYVGTVCGIGRSICFDGKMCKLANYFPVGKRDHFTPEQRDYLIEQGQAGAIAGLLIEATALKKFFWLAWDNLPPQHVSSIQWTDERLIYLGDTFHIIRFDRIPGVIAQKVAS